MEFVYLLFFFVAFLYASVGHGGASSYLALLALMEISTDLSKSSALVMNVLVASLAFINFYRVVKFPFNTFFWLVLGSIPASYLGSKIPIDPHLYKFILGCLLIFGALRLFDFNFFKGLKNEKTTTAPTPLFLLLIGVPIGLISGMIGIGGGIILSPLILILGWYDAKETAAISSGFIVLNSLAGLVGNPSIFLLLLNPTASNFPILWIIASSLLGGLFGSWKGAVDFSNTTIKKVLAVVLIIASIKLILEYCLNF